MPITTGSQGTAGKATLIEGEVPIDQQVRPSSVQCCLQPCHSADCLAAGVGGAISQLGVSGVLGRAGRDTRQLVLFRIGKGVGVRVRLVQGFDLRGRQRRTAA
ncbi:hypothetical protein D9M68_875710 [compost metagenome]